MNVYYLPTRGSETPAIDVAGPRWPILKARVHRAWWRARLTASEVWLVIRRGSSRNLIEEPIWLAMADKPAPRRPLGPARIIDFEAARRRRALVAAGA